ncbi:MAG: DHH family phosphoesterase [Eubacterium sp.]|nr:DHH family phosphoesterase [Eubacterium sp.]
MSDKNISASFKRYLVGPIWLIFVLVLFNIGVYTISRRAGAVMTVGLLMYLLLQVLVFTIRKHVLMAQMVGFASEYGQLQQRLLRDLSLPYAIANTKGKLLWVNDAFSNLTGVQNEGLQKSVSGLFPGITADLFPEGTEPREVELLYGKQFFIAQIRRIEAGELLADSGFASVNAADDVVLYAFILYDQTELHRYMQKYRDEAMVAGLIYIDNYEEALDSVEEVRRSLLTALIERRITKYFHDLDGVVKNFEKDKYILVMHNRSLDELKNLRFSILENVKAVNIGNYMEVTISIGIGVNAGTLTENFEAARTAIDLALGRGGDQVVVKDRDSNYFYGGKTEAVEKSTRVKARVKAHALKEFIEAADEIVIMGHQLIDADAFGAAVGLYRAARTLNKKVHIVIGQITSSMRPLIDLFRESPDFNQEMFLTKEEAEELVNNDTLLIVVDTSKPGYTECPPLLRKTKTIVVLDHHRQSGDTIRNAVLSYIEPYASSSCEMVAEILQYFSEGVRIRNIEADALYAGVMIDTDNFMQKTGVRTFEAAAFLRKNGADVTRVRKLFRENMNDYRARGETIRNAILYRDRFAIAKCPVDGIDSPTIVASQSANALLNIIGVHASFVLTEYDNRIYISARAIDEVNVQIIMERMGGGGHLNMAGCQLDGMTIDEAIEQLKKTLDEMLEAGEL